MEVIQANAQNNGILNLKPSHSASSDACEFPGQAPVEPLRSRLAIKVEFEIEFAIDRNTSFV